MNEDENNLACYQVGEYVVYGDRKLWQIARLGPGDKIIYKGGPEAVKMIWNYDGLNIKLFDGTNIFDTDFKNVEIPDETYERIKGREVAKIIKAAAEIEEDLQ